MLSGGRHRCEHWRFPGPDASAPCAAATRAAAREGAGVRGASERGDIIAGMREEPAADARSIAGFQRLIAETYGRKDGDRGLAGTFMWFTEEVGELARALKRDPPDEKNLRVEFADVLAWLCTLANINRVDLEAAVREKYLTTGGPDGVKH